MAFCYLWKQLYSHWITTCTVYFIMFYDIWNEYLFCVGCSDHCLVQVSIMFVTLEKISQTDPKYADIILLENYAAFQNRYNFGLSLFLSLQCSNYSSGSLIHSHCMQFVWSCQCGAYPSQVLSPGKRIIRTSLHTLYQCHHL